MSLQAPNLDDRKFQDIVSEARSKIPVYCPKWTDYNLSDPGVTLIELFAWMTDMILYRLNRVPEKNYIKFMDLIGLRLEPPRPARADITFRLSAPQPQAVTIPAGTEVGTVRTETEESIVFTTDEDLPIVIPGHVYALTTPDGAAFTDCLAAIKSSDMTAVPIFEAVPRETNALYLGYTDDLSAMSLMLTIDCTIEGIGIDPRDPPLAWEYWDTEQGKWLAMRLESDSTGGLNTMGQVIVYIPYTVGMSEVDGKRAFWIRCRATKPRPKQRPYTTSPKINGLISESIGGTVPASHCFRITKEVPGRSDGIPGQKYNLHNFPVLARKAGETIEVETEVEGQYEHWLEVADFAESNPDSPHFTLDGVTGEIQFGPVIRQPSGEERQYGKIPAAGRQIRMTSHRWGGGVIGNVGERTLTVLRSSIPYISAVTNFRPAVGGTDAESMERAKMRAPQLLHGRTRAVTADDFEYLALEASSTIARAKCLVAGTTIDRESIPAGVVRLLLVPKTEEVDKPVPPERLALPGRVRDEVMAYLDERRLIGTRIEIGLPEYVPVAVSVRIKAGQFVNADSVMADVSRRLYRFLNPVLGGPEGTGWPFGRNLFFSEVSGVIQRASGIDYIDEIKLYTVDPKTGERQTAGSRIVVPPNGLICSAEHQVIVVAESQV